MTTDRPTVTDPADTLDAFHRGRFWLIQPRKGGHRAGMDAMMLAAAVASDFSGRLADFGAGAGAAGLAVAARCPQAEVVLVEMAPDMAEYAQKTLSEPANARLATRVSVLAADVSLSGNARIEAGLADNSFDYVIMNPPFNFARDRATPEALRRQAHVMDEELFERWIRSAAAVVKPRGGLAIIARPESLAAILAAMEGRFGGAEIVPVHPRSETPAIRIIVRATYGSRKPLSLRMALVLHETGEAYTSRADDICNGNASLFGD